MIYCMSTTMIIHDKEQMCIEDLQQLFFLMSFNGMVFVIFKWHFNSMQIGKPLLLVNFVYFLTQFT